ncbi:MAG: hypothetical protein ACFE89_05630 [Candidatus Hodarchaeota archaeon]
MSVGTVVAGITPMIVIHEGTVMIDGPDQESVFRERMLYARTYRLIIQVQQGESVDCLFVQIGGEFLLNQTDVGNFFEYGVLPSRGYYNLVLTNNHAELAIVHVSLALTGPDSQQLFWGESLFILGFVLALLNAVYEWKKGFPL